MIRRLSRRALMRRAVSVSALGAVPRVAFAQAAAVDAAPYVNLAPDAARTLEAIVARLIPSDASGPGALEAGAARYIDRALGDALAAARALYTSGLAAVDAYAQRTAGLPFAALSPERQDALLGDLEQNAATGFSPSSAAFFDMVVGHTLEGTFGDPHYGGNRDFIGWDLIGYPGLRLSVTADEQRMRAELRSARLSAYDLPMFDADDEHDDR